MARNLRDKLLVQGSILAAAGIITKVIGFAYRIPMANVLGNQGNGIYSVAFGIYNIALTLSSYSLPLAVSKLVSARVAKKEYQNVYKVFVMALIFAFVVGGIACTLLWFGAEQLELIYHRNGLSIPLKILAPTTLVVAVLGVFRGLIQGHGNMMPTGLSQIIEQIVNAVISVVAAMIMASAFAVSPLRPAYSAAGGTMGTLCGALAALIFFLFVYHSDSMQMKRRAANAKGEAETGETIIKLICITVLPVILSQTIYQIGYTIDDLIWGNVMADRISDVEAASLQGAFNTQYNQLVNLPVAISSAMAASIVPGIVRARVQGDRELTHHRIDIVLRFNMCIAFPCAFGLTILGRPVVALLFPSLSDYEELAGMLLMTGSSAVVFYALSTITSAILQGSDLMRVPVYHSAISLAIHIFIVYTLLKYTHLGIFSLIVGNVTFPLLVSILNCRSLKRRLEYRFDIRRIFALPLIASVAMGLVTLLSYRLVFFVTGINAAALIVSIGASVAVYGAVLLRSGVFSRDELGEIPLGGRLKRFVK